MKSGAAVIGINDISTRLLRPLLDCGVLTQNRLSGRGGGGVVVCWNRGGICDIYAINECQLSQQNGRHFIPYEIKYLLLSIELQNQIGNLIQAKVRRSSLSKQFVLPHFLTSLKLLP